MKTMILIASMAVLSGFIFRKDISKLLAEPKERKAKGGKNVQQPSEGITIVDQWELPVELMEVSGITYLDKDRFACVQDEKGVIFIFNKTTRKVEKEIPFAGPGDFEGIAIKGNMAFIVRADGVLFEADMTTGKSAEYKTALTVQQNIEGLCYDPKNDRLLLAVKNDDPGYPGFKGIYGFEPTKHSFIKEPVFKIDLSNAVFADGQSKKSRPVMPSGIAIHPVTNDMYITDGTRSRLLIMDQSGVIKKLYDLGKDFYQPEGITIDPQGQIFISNEGKKFGNIIQVKIQ